MQCSCDHVPHAFFADEAPAGWRESLQRDAQGNWKTLERCPTCGRRFALDVWDKYQPQVVIRVHDVERWETEADDVVFRKALLLRARGGHQVGTCGWADCTQPKVRGVAYCLDHLWSTGARR